MKAGAFTPAIPEYPERTVIKPESRSMKAGAFTPAIRCPSRRRPDHHARSMKAGAFTPAIPAIGQCKNQNPYALNEGGGFHPRNPAQVPMRVTRNSWRSMKAGAFTPAIPDVPGVRYDLVGHRSMKAGAFTPAIRRASRWRSVGLRTLNEGGGFHPRNPRLSADACGREAVAQ